MAAGLSSDAIGRLQRLDGGSDGVAFLEVLVLRGSSSNTVPTYGLGLLHFLGWLASRGLALGAVDRREATRLPLLEGRVDRFSTGLDRRRDCTVARGEVDRWRVGSHGVGLYVERFDSPYLPRIEA